MASGLQQLNIFELRPLISNFNCKLSTITDYDIKKQLLCLVSEDNDIVIRFTNESGSEVLKLVSWFRRTNRVIHDICFDPLGSWLLVLCFDNTLHIVPALALVEKTITKPENISFPIDTQQPQNVEQQQQLYSTSEVTSYIIPFVGPHECPNSQKCPIPNLGNESPADQEQLPKESEEFDTSSEDFKLNDSNDIENKPTLEAVSYEMPSCSSAKLKPTEEVPDNTGNSQVMATSFMVSKSCPYPLSVVWWRTIDGVNRAIIGYSDGSICFVGLSPNCPFIASTAIDTGSAVKLLICKDNTFGSTMLLIGTSLKQQFKLLLEEKSINYIYPGDISPTGNRIRDNDWQIVMPLKPTTIGSNPPGPEPDNSVLEDDVFSDKTESTLASSPSYTMLKTSSSVSKGEIKKIHNSNIGTIETNTAGALIGTGTRAGSDRNNESKAIETDANTSTVGGGGTRMPQRDITELDEYGRAGILPAARARLASLKSLGSKKLNAIKMRLSDNRQKLEEYLPENTQSDSFAIINSPSLTPELLGSSMGSFYTLQSLQSTHLLSALHSQSDTLTVHSFDINLMPLFLYKIPKNCIDVLISSNVLYSIQYVDLKKESKSKVKFGNEKQSQDGDSKKSHRQSAEKIIKIVDLKQEEDEEEEEETSNRDSFGLEKIMDSVKNLNRNVKNMLYVKEEPEKVLEIIDLRPDLNEEDDISDFSAETSSSSNDLMTPSNSINAVGVISSAMASLHSSNEDKFNSDALLGLFRFENETVLSLYQMFSNQRNQNETSQPTITKEEKIKTFKMTDIRSPMDYVDFYKTDDAEPKEYSLKQIEIMAKEFPKLVYDPCYVITNKNVYYIQVKKDAFAIFLEAVLALEWVQCRQFCTTFDLNFETCMEFAGDYLLRCQKVSHALVTYSNGRIKFIRTALKLAMFGHPTPLLHFCGMALKISYILTSQFLCHRIIKTILSDITYRHSEDVRHLIAPEQRNLKTSEGKPVGSTNEGVYCSDFKYKIGESHGNLQLPPSTQFHLSNLLLITLSEKAVKDKNYIPLWNFITTNTKFHTNMTSIVLCQSGLFSSALLLAKVRGVCIDVFLALTSVLGQEFELSVCLYNLSELMFAETITYLPSVSLEYFNFIQDRIENIRTVVLERLEAQLNPFSPTLRPIVSHTSSSNLTQNQNDNNPVVLDFCKGLIETYLAVIIHMESQRPGRDRIKNAFSSFRINYEDNQFAIETSRFKPISAGCAHCACVVDGVAYFWGSKEVPCNFSSNKTSEAPDAANVVKKLELLSQLNLEVHAVKCGRQHSLILTNNGLYAFGSNTLSQLGIGNHMEVALEPVLIKAFDGKNITILEAGQYHNAVVANGILYTWGWGIYGQLGHGDTENIHQPRVVCFFKFMKIIQVSLGHAHSMVLCQTSSNTELYVFGSNHFGQLGIGPGEPGEAGSLPSDSALHCASQVKSLVPIKLEISNAKIRLIHTKFFSNLAVDENDKVYTWGTSPQALRLINQNKKRANAKQKTEELQRRFEATMKSSGINDKDKKSEVETTDIPTSLVVPVDVETSKKEVLNSSSTVPQSVDEPQVEDTEVFGDNERIVETTLDNDKLVEPIDGNVLRTSVAVTTDIINEVVEELTLPTELKLSKPINPLLKAEIPQVEIPESENYSEKKTDPDDKHSVPLTQPPDVDPTEHMKPQIVDTSEVAGKILQISSGLFHFAIISSSSTLYTWGRNFQHQLGTEDKERRPVFKPSPIDSIENPMYVDCGADFTIVMSTDYVVKAFGGNASGQCGRSFGPTMDRYRQRVVYLPTTKRLLRYEVQCVEVPEEINLPRPIISLDNEPVRYLKSLPRYQSHFAQESAMQLENEQHCNQPSTSQRYKSTDQADSSENILTGQESDDMVSSLENLSNNDQLSINITPNQMLAAALSEKEVSSCSLSCHCNSFEEQSYTRLPQVDMEVPHCQKTSSSSLESPDSEGQELRNYIHYCLYVFHGLYNPDKIRYFSKDRLEYQIRTKLLNFHFIDAFKLCLEDCQNGAKTLKIFEYFTKDTGYIPMRRQDFKYLIYYLMMHFLGQKFDLHECERFLLADLDYYLLELAYVLYFNNNNTVLEQNLNRKFKSLIAHDIDNDGRNNENNNMHKLEDTDVIFDCLSIKFKTIVCQRLIKYCSN